MSPRLAHGLDIDLTIAAMDNMRKNFDTIPREEAIIKAGSVVFANALITVPSRISLSIWEV